MKKRMLVAATAALLLTGVTLTSVLKAQTMPTKEDKAASAALRKPSGRKVSVAVGGKAFVVDLYDNPTARDLLTKLPMTLKAGNYPDYDEKLLRLPKGLSMAGAPRGDEPLIPEVGYYEPGRWIALYYGPIGYWPGKVPLGRIDATVDEVRAIANGASVTLASVQ